MYSLYCDYYHHIFVTIGELVDDILTSGMDPNYEITKNGVRTGEMLTDFITE